MNPGITDEVGQTTRSFLDIMKEQPLSLSLVVMNFLIVAYLFYSGAQQLAQRKEMAEMIVQWSKETDKILGNCVSIETMKLVVDALERDRELYRRILPPLPSIPAPPSPLPREELKPEVKPQNNKSEMIKPRPLLPLPILEKSSVIE